MISLNNIINNEMIIASNVMSIELDCHDYELTDGIDIHRDEIEQ